MNISQLKRRSEKFDNNNNNNNMSVRTHISTYVHEYIHIYIYAYISMYIHKAYMCICIYIYTHTHSHTHTHTRTYVCTYTQNMFIVIHNLGSHKTFLYILGFCQKSLKNAAQIYSARNCV